MEGGAVGGHQRQGVSFSPPGNEARSGNAITLERVSHNEVEKRELKLCHELRVRSPEAATQEAEERGAGSNVQQRAHSIEVAHSSIWH